MVGNYPGMMSQHCLMVHSLTSINDRYYMAVLSGMEGNYLIFPGLMSQHCHVVHLLTFINNHTYYIAVLSEVEGTYPIFPGLISQHCLIVLWCTHGALVNIWFPQVLHSLISQ